MKNSLHYTFFIKVLLFIVYNHINGCSVARKRERGTFIMCSFIVGRDARVYSYVSVSLSTSSHQLTVVLEAATLPLIHGISTDPNILHCGAQT